MAENEDLDNLIPTEETTDTTPPLEEPSIPESETENAPKPEENSENAEPNSETSADKDESQDERDEIPDEDDDEEEDEESQDETDNNSEEEPKRKRNLAHIIMLSVLAALLIATIILVALLAIPYSASERPVIEIGDSNGAWEDQGTIAMFGDGIRPGSKGKYEFALKNPHEYELSYAFSLLPKYEEGQLEYFPLRFRLRMNNLIVHSDEWLSVDELKFTEMYIVAGSMQTFTLEWSWPFEAGTDANDTLLGENDGTVALVLQMSAQAR